MGLTTRKKPTVVEESKFGVYVWELPNGQWIGDDEGNWLNIASEKGNVKRIMELAAAAKSYGIEEGRAVFLSGHRQIDDEELARQKMRLEWGLVPDEYDIPAMLEAAKDQGKYDGR